MIVWNRDGVVWSYWQGKRWVTKEASRFSRVLMPSDPYRVWYAYDQQIGLYHALVEGENRWRMQPSWMVPAVVRQQSERECATTI